MIELSPLKELGQVQKRRALVPVKLPKAVFVNIGTGRARQSLRAVAAVRNAFVGNGGRLQRPAGRGRPPYKLMRQC
jgi:hypothetical protein